MELSKEQLVRYSRQINVKEFGEEGQKRLLASKALVVGAGGLGSPVIMYLAAAGVGTIGIMDGDTVECSNLQRQIIHKNSSEGMEKTESAKRAVYELNPEVKVNTYFRFADVTSLADIAKGYDIVLDCTDSFESKFTVSDACVKAKVPLVHAAVSHFSGQVMLYEPKKGPCYRCIFSEPPLKGEVKTPLELGVIGAMVGIVGSIQALEGIRYLSGVSTSLSGCLLRINALDMSFKKMRLPSSREDCPVCSKS